MEKYLARISDWDSDDNPFFPTSETPNASSIPTGFSDPFLPTGSSSFPQVFAETEPVPQPLECLHGTPIPLFLSKTYDLVEDPNLNPIIPWGSRVASFVIWDPIEFSGQFSLPISSTIILPALFVSSILMDFVRLILIMDFVRLILISGSLQMRVFLRGNRHLLKNIDRRKSPQSGVVSEIEKLRIEKSALMQGVIDLLQQQRGTAAKFIVPKIAAELIVSFRTGKKSVPCVLPIRNPSSGGNGGGGNGGGASGGGGNGGGASGGGGNGGGGNGGGGRDWFGVLSQVLSNILALLNLLVAIAALNNHNILAILSIDNAIAVSLVTLLTILIMLLFHIFRAF